MASDPPLSTLTERLLEARTQLFIAHHSTSSVPHRTEIETILGRVNSLLLRVRPPTPDIPAQSQLPDFPGPRRGGSP